MMQVYLGEAEIKCYAQRHEPVWYVDVAKGEIVQTTQYEMVRPYIDGGRYGYEPIMLHRYCNSIFATRDDAELDAGDDLQVIVEEVQAYALMHRSLLGSPYRAEGYTLLEDEAIAWVYVNELLRHQQSPNYPHLHKTRELADEDLADFLAGAQ